MKPSRFSKEQIIAILREQEAELSMADVCPKPGVSTATVLSGRRSMAAWMCKLEVLEDENARLKRLLATAMPNNAVLKEPASKNWQGLPFVEGLSRIFGSSLA